MSESRMQGASEQVYRVDRYVVPDAAREEFLERVWTVHAMLRRLPGFVRDLVLEQPSGAGELRVVTLVEWESAEALEHARAAIASAPSHSDADRLATLARLGVTVDRGEYRDIST